MLHSGAIKIRKYIYSLFILADLKENVKLDINASPRFIF